MPIQHSVSELHYPQERPATRNSPPPSFKPHPESPPNDTMSGNMTDAQKGHAVAEQVYLHQKDEAKAWEQRADDLLYSGAPGTGDIGQDVTEADQKSARAEKNANIAAVVLQKHRADAAKK
ncbi:hypothetical protein B0T16DRAFT_497160 [Cercophora newfieldiana]|uniref:Uncharacterized protein n=1 Tax=Cercophora newfieldiana TaxID=92897 RepID=A0AA40CIR2_9PEZI|nr:hypothetical protein B0T16DRAFT_497160 [Cercophora newfieldiana]